LKSLGSFAAHLENVSEATQPVALAAAKNGPDISDDVPFTHLQQPSEDASLAPIQNERFPETEDVISTSACEVIVTR